MDLLLKKFTRMLNILNTMYSNANKVSHINTVFYPFWNKIDEIHPIFGVFNYKASTMRNDLLTLTNFIIYPVLDEIRANKL